MESPIEINYTPENLISNISTNILPKEGVQGYLSSPDNLFAVFRALKQEDVMLFIEAYCQGDSPCYIKIQTLSASSQLAYICYALITEDINGLDKDALKGALQWLQENHSTSPLNKSLEWACNFLQDKDSLSNTLPSTKDNTPPCYINYSGVDFRALKYLKDINFSGTNCRTANFSGLTLEGCHFIATNLSAANFSVSGGSGCQFLNAQFKGALIIDATAYANQTTFKERLNQLHGLLSSSKGRNSIKVAITVNILNELKDNTQKKEYLAILNTHPLITEHRNTFVWGTNKVFSMLTSSNMIPTNGQRQLLQLNTQGASNQIQPTLPLRTQNTSDLGVFSEDIWCAGIAPRLKCHRDVSALMLTCRFFANHKELEKTREALLLFKMAAGGYHTLQPSNSGKLWVGGRNDYGQLGLSHNRSVNGFAVCVINKLQAGEYVRDVKAGAYHTVVITNQNRVLVSGGNYYGQLGLSHNRSVNSFEVCVINNLQAGEYVRDVKTGPYHTVVITNQNRVLVSGHNFNGQLGLSHNRNVNSFEVCAINNLQAGEYVRDVKAGAHHTLVITNQNRVLVSGENRCGQLGLSHNRNVNSFEVCVINNLQAGEYVRDVIAGDNHTLVITNQNRVLVSGRNDYGELGLSHINDVNSFEVCVINNLQAGEYVRDVIAGAHHTLVITNQNRVLVSGGNYYGQLGLSHNRNVNSFEVCDIKNLQAGEYVRDVKAGYNHTLVITNQNRVLVSGCNDYGQLGLSHNRNVNSFEVCNTGPSNACLKLGRQALGSQEATPKEDEQQNCSIQ